MQDISADMKIYTKPKPNMSMKPNRSSIYFVQLESSINLPLLKTLSVDL